MRFERIRLENFKCYADADLSLGDGITVVHGLNGSGKSSLLEAAFFALYGARALDRTLEDVVTIGADAASVELWFAHDGAEYRIERRIRATGDRAETAACTLETPDGAVDGARDVRERVAGLLRMDAEAFLNCAYVRQGEVNKLINATPGERQSMIDDLLQLGKLEDYRDRAGDARLGVEDVLGEARGTLQEVEAQIEDRDEAALHARLDELEAERNELDEEIERYETNREEAETTLEEAAETLEAAEERREELAAVESDLEDLEGDLAEREREREQHGERIADLREERATLDERIEERAADLDLEAATAEAVAERVDALEAEIDALDDDLESARTDATMYENQAENLAERADELAADAEQRRERADDLEAAAEERADDLAERRDRLAALEDRIEALESQFDDAPVDPDGATDLREERADDLEAVREEIADVRADLEAARREVERAEELLEAGKCPECGQPVEGAPHVEDLAAERERVTELEADLAALEERAADREAALEAAEDLVSAATDLRQARENRSSVAALIEERAADLEADRERAADLREAAGDLEREAEQKQRVAAEKETEAATTRERVTDLEAKRESLVEERDAVAAVGDLLEERADRAAEIERLVERREDLADVAEQLRERLAEKRERRRELADAVDEERVEAARAEKERAESYLADVEATLVDLRERRDALGEEIGGVTRELDELADLRERRAEVAERVDRLESLREETGALEDLYGDLRAELRQRNVATLERMLNETFDLVYGNDSYTRIELDGEYELTVYQKDGRELDPEQLSGGERALFNLSLRCAIYRLLAEGIDGAAPMPPLILDEPTVFLDDGHVSRLVDLVDSMHEHGVEQVIVVSHDDELAGAADHLVRVEKDATTNRSTVERVPAGPATL